MSETRVKSIKIIGLQPVFRSDGSVSTGSLARDGQPFSLLRPCSCPDEVDAENAGTMWKIQFGDGEIFTAWDEEIFILAEVEDTAWVSDDGRSGAWGADILRILNEPRQP